MSENKTSVSQDPSLTVGNQVDFQEIDLHSPEVIEMLKEHGELFRRKIEAIKGVREPDMAEQVDTVVNGIVESSQVAEPGKHKIITGSRGEQFVFTNEKYDSLYSVDEQGNVTPRERRVLAMQNPYGGPVRIEAPWSTPENPQTQDGTEEAMLTFGLDDTGELTDDRYLIGDREMLLNNYEPVVVAQSPKLT
jgi:hypothetical protein